jgi:hypothetical protein
MSALVRSWPSATFVSRPLPKQDRTNGRIPDVLGKRSHMLFARNPATGIIGISPRAFSISVLIKIKLPLGFRFSRRLNSQIATLQAEIEPPAGEVVEHSAPANVFRTSMGVVDGCS